MKYFKTEPSYGAERYEITREEYKRVTELKYPFGRSSDRSSNQKNYYAVCPACLNPIQIIGMGENSKVKPYGKHAGKAIPKLAGWNYKKYVNCPFTDSSVRINPSAEYEKVEVDRNAVELYNLLRDNFDLVVMTIEDALQIHAGSNYWRKCLRKFVNDQEYCYPWLTDSNLPYIFALQGMVYSSLFGLSFHMDSEICKAVEKVPGVILSDPNSYGYRKWEKSFPFVELQFRFIDHKRYASDGEELKESICVYVDQIKNGKAHVRYEEKLIFNESAFDRKRKYVKSRWTWLLDMAKHEMPDIKPNV